MNRTEPPKGTLDPQQPWYKGGGQNLSAAFWDRFKAKLTGGTDASGTSYFSMVKITSADADKIIANMKKDPRGYPQMDQGNPNALYDYQNWIVEEYLEGPFREEVNDKIEQAALNNQWKQLAEKRKKQQEQQAKKEAAKNFVSSSSTLRPGKKIAVKTSRMSGIIPRRPIPQEVAERISQPIAPESTETSAAAPKSIVSSMGRLTLDLLQVNNNLDKIAEVIQEDYAQTKAKNKKEIEEYRKRIANRERRLPKKDLGQDKKSLKELIKPFVGGFFSGLGGAIRGLAAFNLIDAILNGDIGKIVQSLLGIGITFIPQIGMMIAGAVVKSMLKSMGRRAFMGGMRGGGRVPRSRGMTPRRMGIGKFGAAMALGAGALSLGSAYLSSQKDDGADRLDELEAQEKALAAGGYAAITDGDLKRFENLNKKFAEILDNMMTKGRSKGAGGGPGSSPAQTMGGQISGDPVAMNMETRGTVAGEQFDVKQRIELLKKVGATDEEAIRLAAIATYESSGNTRAHNPDASTGDNSYGLWQVNMLGKLGEDRRSRYNLSSNEDLFDPVTNAQVALAILRSSGWGAWTTNTKVTAADLEKSRTELSTMNSGSNESGGYTSKSKIRSISSTPPPSRGVIVNMVPIAPETGGLGSINVEGSEDVMMVNPSNPDDIIGKLYRTQWNIVDVG